MVTYRLNSHLIEQGLAFRELHERGNNREDLGDERGTSQWLHNL